MLPAAPVQDLEPVEDRAITVPTKFGYTPLAAAFRYVDPTWRNYIMYVDLEARTGNAEAKRYVEIWKSLPAKERLGHVPEQLCELANVPAADLIAWVTKQIWTENSAKTSVVMSFMKAPVIQKTAEFAMESADNYKHADLFMKAAGMLPTGGRGGGSPVTIYNSPVASSGSVALAGSKSDSSPVGASGLRSMDEEIVEMSRVMQLGDAVPCAAELMPDEFEEEDEGQEELE
jgi:hypothetical protein